MSTRLQFDKSFTAVDSMTSPHRVALVHDWLTGMRGGEMVLEQLCSLFPGADLFTLVHKPGSVSKVIENRRIFESPIVKLPGGRSRFRSYLPLFPWAIESFELREYDLIISTSHCAAKGIIPPPTAVNISYIHTPMRYVWDIRSDYLGPIKLNSVQRAVAGVFAHYLRNWDTVSSSRVDHFIANSEHVKRRIEKFYRRDATVIYPPVAVDRFTPGDGDGDYFLTVSSLVPYKRIDIAVEACRRGNFKLVVVGDGPERPLLESIAGKETEFVGWLPHDELVEVYRNSKALLFPGVEDFGITPVESQACGRPVIAYRAGGALETVIEDGPDRSGIFFNSQSPEDLLTTMRQFDPSEFDPQTLRMNSERFGRERFLREITQFISDAWDAFCEN